MNAELVMGQGLWNDLRKDLFRDCGDEGFALGLARPVRVGGVIRFVMERALHLEAKDYERRGACGLTLTASASSRINVLSAKASSVGLVPVHLHSHPQGVTQFSGHDDTAERLAHQWLQEQGQPWLLSLVQARGSAPHVRLWRKNDVQECGLRIGLQRFRLPDETERSTPNLPALDRQRAFGADFARSASRLRVGVVGVGGVGMPVAEMLARSGCARFVLVDADTVEESNLNRLGHATRRDVNRLKVNLCRSIIQKAGRAVGTRPRVRTFAEYVNLGTRGKEALAGCDLILALTDDELSRITCLKLALEYGVEYLQAGVRIGQDGDRIDSLAVEVTGAESERYCPLCTGRLDPGQASVDARRYVGGEVAARARAEGYIPEEPAPSVMSLNALAAGALVLEIQKRMAGLPAVDLWQHDLLTGKTLFRQSIENDLAGSCAVCGRGEIETEPAAGEMPPCPTSPALAGTNVSFASKSASTDERHEQGNREKKTFRNSTDEDENF